MSYSKNTNSTYHAAKLPYSRQLYLDQCFYPKKVALLKNNSLTEKHKETIFVTVKSQVVRIICDS